MKKWRRCLIWVVIKHEWTVYEIPNLCIYKQVVCHIDHQNVLFLFQHSPIFVMNLKFV